MHNRIRILIPVLLILALAVTAGWYLLRGRNTSAASPLQASGTVESVDVLVASELAGRVAEVLVDKGDVVNEGDPLLRLDDELLQSQRQGADVALEAARSALTTAQAGLELAQSSARLAQIGVDSAQVQYEITLNAARLTDQPARAKAWRVGEPSEFDQPNWYFSKAEEMAAAQAEAGEAYQVLQAERASFDNVIEKSGSAELKAADERLARARAGFLVAKDVLERARSQNDQELRDYAQTIYDAAEAELDAAQTEYDNLLSKSGSEDVMEARARLAVAQERYDTALDRLNKLLVGDDSLQVRAAELGQSQARAALEQAAIGVKQAQARVDQAEKAVEQAKAQLNLIDVQIKKLTVYASTSGVIIGRNLEPGEVIQPGATVMTIGKLENLKITVYIPEDLYGQIKLGQKASVTVDSYPGETFQAVVDHIADQAEFTPRNVQTAEGRKTTVYAVELTIDAQAAASGKLKPGMPADVHFENE